MNVCESPQTDIHRWLIVYGIAFRMREAGRCRNGSQGNDARCPWCEKNACGTGRVSRSVIVYLTGWIRPSDIPWIIVDNNYFTFPFHSYGRLPLRMGGVYHALYPPICGRKYAGLLIYEAFTQHMCDTEHVCGYRHS